MKIKFLLFCSLLILSSGIYCNYASPEYQEINTSLGKIVIGLNREEALERFGSPTSATEDVWYYSDPKTFFIYFSSTSVLSTHLYPKFCEAAPDVPLELKAFGYFPDLKVKDITSLVQFLFSEPQSFVLEKPGVVIPTKPGEYQIMVKYKGIFSNPSYITIRGPQEERADKEKLLSIDVLPFKPKVPPESKLSFVALGTFLDPAKNRYFIRDISQEVMWFIQQDTVTHIRSQEIYFGSVGKFKVFCKYQDIESFPQEVEVQSNLRPFKEILKHITLLPEFIFINLNNNINLKAFATYHNNRVEDITPKVKWRVSDREVVTPQETGQFLSKSEGVTGVIAELDNLESLPTKIVVVSKKDLPSTLKPYTKPKESKINLPELMRGIKNSIERLSDSLAKERRLKSIRIVPDYLRISLGEKRQVAAYGMYSDDSQSDLTVLGEWVISNERVATASKGVVEAKSLGEAKIYVKFREITSLPASVTVEGPRLVSIIVSPQNSQISMRDSLNLKAEGYYTDSARKDITSLVTWTVANPRIIKVEKGRIRPKRIGSTQVRAEYSGITSLPVDIRVVITRGWLIRIIMRRIAFLILSVIIIFAVLYLLTENKKNKLKVFLSKNPKEFIIRLYENTNKILIIFGFSYKWFIPWLSYAKLIEDKYSVEGNLFLRFTAKFEEAKYSHHILQYHDAVSALNDYRNFLKILFSRYRKFSLFFKYCLTLLHRKPLFV